MRLVFLFLIAASCFFASVAALPHHSFAAEFDLKRPIELTGTVTRVQWTNPHAWLHIDVVENGNVQSWAIELLGINSLVRRGWTHNTVSAGDLISVEGFGARDGSNTGNASVVTLASTGQRLWDSANQ